MWALLLPLSLPLLLLSLLRIKNNTLLFVLFLSIVLFSFSFSLHQAGYYFLNKHARTRTYFLRLTWLASPMLTITRTINYSNKGRGQIPMYWWDRAGTMWGNSERELTNYLQWGWVYDGIKECSYSCFTAQSLPIVALHKRVAARSLVPVTISRSHDLSTRDRDVQCPENCRHAIHSNHKRRASALVLWIVTGDNIDSAITHRMRIFRPPSLIIMVGLLPP